MDDHRRSVAGAVVAALLLVAFAPRSHAAEPAAALTQARAALSAWRLSDADALLAGAPEAADRTELAVLRGRLDLQRSRFDAVISRLQPVVAAHPEVFEARVVLGQALTARGDKRRAFDVLDPMATEYSEGRVTTARDLMWLAMGLWMTGYPKNANQIFAEAIETYPQLHEARVAWAALFVDKYNFKDADLLYLEVLKAEPGHTGALLGRAQIDILSDRELVGAREKATTILAGAPEHVPAHNLLALLELHNDAPREAVARLQAQSLRIAPADPEALALLASALEVDDDAKGFKAAEARALASNPKDAAFYTTVSEHLTRVHRYADAAALDRKAIALDPEHYKAYANLGIGMARLGDDAQAKSWLERAFDGDPYDVRTFNLLDQFYDGTIKKYRWLEVAPMRLRVHESEAAVLARYVPALMTEAWKHLVAKYGMRPELPVHVELYPDPQLFAVRSVGLPRLAAHGICFGHVITARSPTPGDFNWAEVVWHELSHVFHIQLSQSRVPRWFTEGLAVYEATEGRPEWRREMDDTLLAWRRAGKLRGVADFDLAFTQARSLDDIVLAYYHAYRVAEFIDTTFGTKRLKRMLELWGQKKKTPAVFSEALGVRDLAAFDASFLVWLDRKLAHLSASFRLDPQLVSADAEALGSAADASPTDVDAQAKAAVAWFGRGEVDAAGRYAAAALAADADQPHALLVRALLRAKGDDSAGARQDAERLVSAGRDGVDVRRLLARLAEKAGDAAAAAGHLERAVAIDPQAGELVYKLISLYDAAGRGDDAWRWRLQLLSLDQGSIGLVSALLEGAEAHGASVADVQRWGELGNHIAPFDLQHHLRFARALKRLGRGEQSRFEASTALLLDPANAEAKTLGGAAPSAAP
jgi:tetratricopeptide (TPR) repeat protein